MAVAEGLVARPFFNVGTPRLPDLDDELQARILTFSREARAAVCCKSWKDSLYTSLFLKQHGEFNRLVAHYEDRGLPFYYSAVRPLSEEFEESVNYNFHFGPNGRYVLTWQRVFDAWSSQTEQHFGSWRIDLGEVLCETLEPPPTKRDLDREIRYAPPGYKFSITLEEILNAGCTYYTAPPGSPVASWELTVRTGKAAEESPAHIQGMWRQEVAYRPQDVPASVVPPNENARFVEIDGELHEVSGDIVANWPEDAWPRLMRCRLRFGIN